MLLNHKSNNILGYIPITNNKITIGNKIINSLKLRSFFIFFVFKLILIPKATLLYNNIVYDVPKK